MADEFTKAALGEAVLVIAQANFKAAETITKGDVVYASAHNDDDLPSISVAGNAQTECVGVAMKDIASGAYGPVLICGIIKVTAGAAAVTVGALIEAAANGAVEDGATATKVIGRAYQTMANGATGLVFVNCMGGGA